MFRQEIPRVGLSIQRGTSAVPDDGFYYVLHSGEVVYRSRSQVRALAEYRRLRDELLLSDPVQAPTIDTAEALRRERMRFDLEALRAEAGQSKRRKAVRKGGKGGSGGVG